MSELKSLLSDTFALLIGALNVLCLHLRDELSDYPVWISDGDDTFSANRDKVIYALKKFTPTPNLAPQETYCCPGVIGGAQQTLELVHAVNHAKDCLKEVIAKCHASFDGNVLKFIRDTLATAGFGTIKLKEACRHIKVIQGHPRRVAWSKGLHSSHKTISKATSAALLTKMGEGKHIDIQLAKLSMLDKASLVQYRRSKALWVANFVIKNEQGVSLRGLIRTGLPIFYLHDAGLTPPVVCFSEKRPRNLKTLARKQLEDKAYLPSISAYRKINIK